MKIKINQLLKGFNDKSIIVERVSGNVLEIKSSQKSLGSILLPEDFEVEKESVQQFIDFANFRSPSGKGVKCACATPDFHKGSTIPVGSVVVTDEDLVIPSAIGTDINCGMRLHHTGLSLTEFLAHKREILTQLKGDLLAGTRDIPTTGKSMRALFHGGLSEFWREIQKNPQGIFAKMDYSRVLQELERLHPSAFSEADSKYAPDALMTRATLRDPSLGTLGGGNHFCEFQVVESIQDKRKAYELGIKVGDVVNMIHTGSRDVGFYVGRQWMDKAAQCYPKGLKHPENKVYALEGELAYEYLKAMHAAAHYATANRALLSEIIRQRIKEVTHREDNRLITDVPHNIILKEDIGNVHRKGATPAHENQLLLIPGSMGDKSYLLNGLGNNKWINSASHGAGRTVSRQKMLFKGRGKTLGLEGVECITLTQERLIEEAPSAYKSIGPVIESQIEQKSISSIATLSPLVTFKS